MGDWLRRVEERLAGVNGAAAKPSALHPFLSPDDPHPFVETFLKSDPLTTDQVPLCKPHL